MLRDIISFDESDRRIASVALKFIKKIKIADMILKFPEKGLPPHSKEFQGCSIKLREDVKKVTTTLATVGLGVLEHTSGSVGEDSTWRAYQIRLKPGWQAKSPLVDTKGSITSMESNLDYNPKPNPNLNHR